MKQFFIIAVLLFVIAAVINNSSLAEPVERAKSGAMMPLRYAQLLAREPDKQIAVPVKGVSAGQIADTWHAPRGSGRQHNGQDIFAKRGTPVTSATDGIVIRIGQNTLGGNTVSVLGAGGRVYYYAHLDRYAEKLHVGDPVTPASVIGYVGTTGNAKGTPPHLHFGIYTMNGAINPLGLFGKTDESSAQPPAGTQQITR